MTENILSRNLHSITKVNDLRKFLRNGCNINERNEFDETPLLCAVRSGEGAQLIEEFLNCGADPNAADLWGKTPLYCALTNHGSLTVMKLLLESGADIKGGKPINDRALDHAFIQNRTCAELLLKYKFLKNSQFVKTFNSDDFCNTTRNFYLQYRDVVDLNLKPSCYNIYSDFLDNCTFEILNMKSIRLNSDYSLVDFVANKVSLKQLGQETMYQIFKELNLKDYHIYYSMIAERIGREYLLKCINEQFLFVNFSVPSKCYKKEYAVLNSDIVYCIAKYLTDSDLLNLILAHLN